jgi:hypothetical protein
MNCYPNGEHPNGNIPRRGTPSNEDKDEKETLFGRDGQKNGDPLYDEDDTTPDETDDLDDDEDPDKGKDKDVKVVVVS